jgi:hypothetical protein
MNRFNGYALKYVPEKYKTEEVYAISVLRNRDFLEYVPSNLRTKRFWKLVIFGF